MRHGRALKALQQAAKDFVARHGLQLVEEFGVSLKCDYKFQKDTRIHEPQDWVFAAADLRSKCLVVFEGVVSGTLPILTAARSYDHVVSHGRGISLPEKLLTQRRKQQSETKVAQATRCTGQLKWDTKLTFECC